MKFIPAAVVLSLFIVIPAFAAEGKAVYCATNNLIVYSSRQADNAPAYFEPTVPLTNSQSEPVQMMK